MLSGSRDHRAGSGDGWTRCGVGHRHWGRFGAAGLLLTSEGLILLQLRSVDTHHGGTWSVPGGARDAHEDAVTAALREAGEEVGIRADAVRVGGTDVDDHGGWSYTTVLARPRGQLTFRPNHETDAVRWVTVDEVGDLALHPGFRSSWPRLRDRLAG
ncbi:MAG: NUDIX hydrolase [Nakamurella sp.]